MNIYIVGFILLLISISPPVLANKKDCETLLNNYKEIKKKTLASLTPRERRIVSSITLEVNPSSNFERVGAFTNPQTKEKKISISCGHMWRIGYIAESVAALIIFKDNLLVGNAVEGYIRYIALNTLFYHPAKRFSDFSDFQIPSNKLAEYFTLINIVAYSLQSSVLYHEFGHHILSHTTKKTTTSAASQKLEIEADKWSVRTMLKNDIIPMMAIYNFFILREYNLNELSNEKTSSHPATIKRMFTFIESTRSSLIDPQVVARINANQPKTGKSVEEIKQKLEQIIYMFENFLNKQKYKASNPVEYAVEYMQQNSRQATLQLADYYSKGKHGIKKNLRKAQELYCQAANSKQIDFDYVGIAQANFMCGYSYWFVSILDKDYEKAKYYLTKSSDMDYSHAVYNLKRLKKSKKK